MKGLKNRWRQFGALCMAVLILGLSILPGLLYAEAADGSAGQTEKTTPELYLTGREGEDGGLLLSAVLPADASGTVEFWMNGTSLGEAVPVENGLAQYAAEVPQEDGTKVSFSASYSGSGEMEAAVSRNVYEYTAGLEFAETVQGNIPASMVYGEETAVISGGAEASVSDGTVLALENGSLKALKPGLAYVLLTASGEGKNSSTAVLPVDVEKRPIGTVGGRVADKEYDGTVLAVLEEEPVLDLTGIAAGDEGKLALVIGEAAFQDKNAGEGKTVVLPMELEGEKADCYELSPAQLTGNIHKKTLEISFQVTAYRGQTPDLDAGIQYEGFIAGETAEGLEAKREFTPGSVSVRWEEGELQEGPEGQEVLSYPAEISGADARNYQLVLPQEAVYTEITYLGQAGSDFVLEYQQHGSWWNRGELTVKPAEGSGYTLVSKTEDFDGAGESVRFSRREVRDGQITFYLKKGEYDPESAQTPNDSGAIAKVTDLSVPASDFQEPELYDLSYQMNGGDREIIDENTDQEDLADIGRFYNDTVTVRFAARDTEAGLDSVLCEWIGEGGGSEEIRITEDHTGEKQIAFDVEPQFRGYIRITLTDRAGHIKTLVYDYLSVDAINPSSPSISATAGGETYVPEVQGEENWTNQDVEILAEGAEALSGVAGYEYTATDGEVPDAGAQWISMETVRAGEADGETPYHVQAASLTIQEDTDRTYWFRAVSNVRTADGSKVASAPVSFQVFRQTVKPEAPEITAEPEEPESGWYGEIPAVDFAEPENDDAHLAPMTIFYQFWNTDTESSGQTVVYDGENPPVIPGDGIYRLRAWTEDAAGNRSEEELDRIFRVDTTAPEITVAYDNMDAENGSYFDRGRTAVITIRELNFREEDMRILAEGTDAEPVVSGFETAADGITHTAQVSFLEDGAYRLSVSYEDPAGNGAQVSEESFTVDTEKPVQVEISYEDNLFREFLNAVTFRKFFKDTVTVTIRAYDRTSGVKTFEYWSNGIDGNGQDKGQQGTVEAADAGNGYYEAVFTIEPQFKGSFSAMAEDLAGNRSDQVESEAIYIDSQVPGAPWVDTGSYEEGTWTNADVRLVVTGSAAFSGVERYEYTVSDGALSGSETWIPMTEGLVVQPDGRESAANVTRAELSIGSDTNKIFYFRAVSNSGVEGQISSCHVQVQKTLPSGASVSAGRPNEEEWYQTDPGIVITAPAATPSPQPGSAPVTVYYKLWNRAAGETEAQAETVAFTGRQPVLQTDGQYSRLVWTEDEAGNRCRAAEEVLTEYQVDYTEPQISLSYDNDRVQNGTYYNAARTATVTVEELNFNPEKIQIQVTAEREGTAISVPEAGQWVSDGSTHRTTVRFVEDGDYTIQVSGSDRADNQAPQVQTQSFTVDTEAPSLTISGVRDMSANKEPVAPVISYDDVNLDLSKVSFRLTGSGTGENLTEGTAGVSGGQLTYTLPQIRQDDNYRLTARIEDLAGNVSEQSVSFSVNQNGSVFEFLQPQVRDRYTNQAFYPSVRVWNVDEVTIVSVSLNGQNVPYTFEDGVIRLSQEVRTDGKYVFTVEVRDAAGNVSSMEPVEFFLDTAAPGIQVDGVEEGGLYFDPVSPVLTLDNAGDTFVEVLVNGEAVPQEQLHTSQGTVTLSLSEYQDYTLTASAQDEAGNRTEMEPVHFTLSDNWFLKLYQNKPLFWGSVSGLCILLAAGTVLTVVLVRRRRYR